MELSKVIISLFHRFEVCYGFLNQLELKLVKEVFQDSSFGFVITLFRLAQGFSLFQVLTLLILLA